MLSRVDNLNLKTATVERTKRIDGNLSSYGTNGLLIAIPRTRIGTQPTSVVCDYVGRTDLPYLVKISSLYHHRWRHLDLLSSTHHPHHPIEATWWDSSWNLCDPVSISTKLDCNTVHFFGSLDHATLQDVTIHTGLFQGLCIIRTVE